jgi:hypothetical protein
MQVEMGIAKQIPQLQPKAKENKRRGQGLYRRGRGWVHVHAASTGRRGRTLASAGPRGPAGVGVRAQEA